MNDEELTMIKKIRAAVDWTKIYLLGFSLFALFIGVSFIPMLREPAAVMGLVQSLSVLSLLAVGLTWLYLCGIRDFSLGGWFLLALGLAQLWQQSELVQGFGFTGVALGALGISVIMASFGLVLGWLYSKRRHSIEFLSLGLAIFLGAAGIALLPHSGVWCEPLFCGKETLPNVPVFVVSIALGFIVSLAAVKHFWPSFRWLGPVILTFVAIGLLNFSVVSYGGLPLAAVVAAIMVFTSYFLLRSTMWGKSVLAVGDNIEAARYCGVSLFKVFAFAGALYLLCISFAAFFEVAVETRIQAWRGYGRQVDAWLAIFIAGVSLRGGKGCFSNVLLGVLFVSVINYLYSATDWPGATLFAFKGLALAIIIWIQTKEPMNR